MGLLMRRAAAIALLLFLAGCAREPLYQAQSYVFGTLVEVTIHGEEEARARVLANHVLQDFQGLHQRLHAWQPDSDLYRLNEALASGPEPVAISSELAQILSHATAMSQQSGGLFNPAIGGLIQQWGFQRDTFTPVKIDAGAIRRLVQANPQMSDIVVEAGQAYSRNPAVRVDLGGYAKGYALDRAVRYLRQQGVKNALINIGGNVIALGRHGDTPWRVGIQHPRQPGPIAMLDLPDGWAIGTSGDYQRFFEQDGQRYCHLIDPGSGYPTQHVQAVTILVPPGPEAGMLSDVATKPIFIAPMSQRAAMAARMGVQHVMVVDGEGSIFVSAGMQARLRWPANDDRHQHAAPQLLQ